MGRKGKQFLTLRETIALFRRISEPRDYALFFVGYRHGLRASEVCSMKMADVDLAENRIFCRRVKGSISGFHKMDERERKVISRWLVWRKNRSSFLFPGRTGCVSRKTLDRLMKKYGALAKLPVSKRHFHVLKHSIAVHMLEGGADIKLVQELLGHRNIQNTLVYAELVSKYRDEKQLELFASKKVF